MEVSEEIHSWLAEANLVNRSKPRGNKFILDKQTSNAFSGGSNFQNLAKRLYQLQNSLDRLTTPMPEINELKNATKASEKLYNWNVLTKAFEMFSITIDPDTKALIVAGDTQMVVEVLEQIYAREQEISNGEVVKNKVAPDGSLLIEAVDPNLPLDQTEISLEFIIVSLCKNFGLKVKQAAGLLTQDNKYLNHVVVKGMKGKYDQVLTWYQDLHAHSKHILTLLTKEDPVAGAELFLGAFKPGFFSKSVEVVQWCSRVFSKLGVEFVDNDIVQIGWDWFVAKDGGISACISALQNHNEDIQGLITSVLIQFARNNFLELFTLHFRNAYPDSKDYIITMSNFISKLSEIRLAKQELLEAEIVDYWVEFCVREVDFDGVTNPDSRLAATGFLTQIWISFQEKIEEKEELANSILKVLKKGVRDKEKLIKYAAISHLFHLLDVFSAERNPFAPIIYKTITFALVEQHSDAQLREYVLINFVNTFNAVPTIPVGVLTEPLIKLISVTEGTSYIYNTFDFDFFLVVARHPRLQVKTAVQMLDVLGKAYLTDLIYGKAAGIPFMLVASRLLDTEPVQEFLVRYCKFMLKIIYDNEKGMGNLKKFKQQSALQGFSDQEIDGELQAIHTKNQIFAMFTRIIKLWNVSFNDRLKPVLVKANNEFKKLKQKDHKGILYVLGLLGDADQLIEEYTVEEEEPPPQPKSPKLRLPPPAPTQVPPDVAQTSPEETAEDQPISFNSYRSVQALPIVKSKPRLNVRSRVMEDLERIKRKKLEKELREKEVQDIKSQDLERKKRSLKKQIEKRKIQLGVMGAKSDKLIFDEAATQRKASGPVLRDLLQETQQDQETVNIVIKRYTRALKGLFKLYSGTGQYYNALNQKSAFEMAQRKGQFLIEAELFKILKDHHMAPGMITKQEMGALMHAYNAKLQCADLSSVDYNRFIGVLVQIALFAYSKPGQDLSHLPPGISVKAMMNQFRNATAERGDKTAVYDHPDPGAGDLAVIKSLNEELAVDKEAQMPEGYKKIIDKELDIEYKIPENVAISQSHRDVIEILDEMFQKKLGFHILEPQVSFKQYYRAKGVQIRSMSIRPGARSLSPRIRGNPYKSSSNMNQRELSPNLRIEVAKASPEDQPVVQECAEVLDNLFNQVQTGDATEHGRTSSLKIRRIQNRVIQQKEEAAKAKKIDEKRAEKRRKLRKQVIEERLKQVAAEKEAKKIEDQKSAKSRKDKNAAIRARIAAKRAKEKEDKELALKEWHERKALEKSQSEANMLSKSKDANILREQLRNRQKKLKEHMKQQVKDRENNQKRQEAAIAKEKEDIKKSRLAREDKFSEARKAKEVRVQKEIEYGRLVARDEIQAIISNKHSKLIETIFRFYTAQSGAKREEDINSPTMTLNFGGFNKFAANFNIWPGLMTSDESLQVFRYFTKAKPSNATIELNFAEFQESFVRFAMTGQKNIMTFLGQEIPQNYESVIEELPATIVEGLFTWMDISDKPKEAQTKLKSFNLKLSQSLRDKKRIAKQGRGSVGTLPDINTPRENPQASEIVEEVEESESHD